MKAGAIPKFQRMNCTHFCRVAGSQFCCEDSNLLSTETGIAEDCRIRVVRQIIALQSRERNRMGEEADVEKLRCSDRGGADVSTRPVFYLVPNSVSALYVGISRS